MASPAYLANVNRVWDAASTLSASSSASGFAVTNLASEKRTLYWRSATTTSDQWIEVDFGSSFLITAIAITDYKIQSGGKATPQYWNGSSFATYVADFTIPSSNRTKLLAQYGNQTTTKIRIDFPSGGPSDYAQCGIVWAGSQIIPGRSVKPGLSFGLNDANTLKVKTIGGQSQFWARPSYVSISALWPMLSRADRDLLLQAYDVNGSNQPVLFSFDASNLDYTIYGVLKNVLTGLHHQTSADLWDVQIDCEELR